MQVDEYKLRGKELIDYIAEYLENIRKRRVFPDVSPGYLRRLVPSEAPLDGEQWDTIFADIERVIMPGVTHWQSPYMHAYFPALNSYPSLLGDMLADAINCLGFTWASSPACTELESVVTDWLGRMIGLPDCFLHSGNDSASGGGGVLQTTASEATLIALLAGRTAAIRRLSQAAQEANTGEELPEPAEFAARLVAYCSDQAHSSVEKAGIIGLVKMRYVVSDDQLSMRGDAVREAIARDRASGLIPFFMCVTLGTTGACSFDNLLELGPICQEEGLWLHVDAAYAGSAFICPEYRQWLTGVELADSIAFNPSKWLLTHFDCTAMWVRSSRALHRTFNVDPIYLKHENSGLAIDYMHWQIPLSKRFRALKLWFVIRSYGIKGLQNHIRKGVHLAERFEALVRKDERFEISAPRHLGMVVLRLRGDNTLTEGLLRHLNASGQIHCVPASLKGRYVIRFTVTSPRTTLEDVVRDWRLVQKGADHILANAPDARPRVALAEATLKAEGFGSSLLLANSPMSPKIVNGSFAAILGGLGQLCLEVKDSPAMRRRIKGILMSGKQFSLDSRLDLVQGGLVVAAAAAASIPGTLEEEDASTTSDHEASGSHQSCHKCGHLIQHPLSSSS